MSNCTDIESVKWTEPGNLVSLAVLAFINVLVIVGNCLVIAAVFCSHKLRSVTNFFIVSLAVADLLVGLAVLPFSATWEVFKVSFDSHSISCFFVCIVTHRCLCWATFFFPLHDTDETCMELNLWEIQKHVPLFTSISIHSAKHNTVDDSFIVRITVMKYRLYAISHKRIWKKKIYKSSLVFASYIEICLIPCNEKLAIHLRREISNAVKSAVNCLVGFSPYVHIYSFQFVYKIHNCQYLRRSMQTDCDSPSLHWNLFLERNHHQSIIATAMHRSDFNFFFSLLA